MRSYQAITPANAPINLSSVQVIPGGDSNTGGITGLTPEYPGYRAWFYQELATTRGLTTTLIGSIVTCSAATPTGYQAGHEGVASETLTQIQVRIVGGWTGVSVHLGDAGDPGENNRGHLEYVCRQRRTNVGLVVMAGTNDATSGAVNTTAYQRFIQQAWSVGAPLGLRWIACCRLIPRTDGHQANNDTFNAALPGLITAMRAAGVFCFEVDTTTGFDTATMIDNAIGSPGLHLKDPAGMTFFSAAVAAAMRAAGVTSA